MAISNFSEPGFFECLKTRDPAALAELADAYLPQLLRAGRGMGFSREENEDLAQSVFLAFLEGLDRFEGRSHIRTFLFGIFYHKVSEHFREKQREKKKDPIDEVMESKFDAQGNWSYSFDIERQIFSQEAKQIIQECLETIPRAQRIAFYLREVEQMETPEICKKMGISVTNLGVLLFRARNRLCECVEKKGVKGVEPCTPAVK